MPTPILTLPPKWGATQSNKVSLKNIALGDGYSLLSPIGFGNQDEQWDIESPALNLTEVQSINAFFEQLAGVDRFNWRPDPTYPLKSWLCETWKITPIGQGLWKFNATFINPNKITVENAPIRGVSGQRTGSIIRFPASPPIFAFSGMRTGAVGSANINTPISAASGMRTGSKGSLVSIANPPIVGYSGMRAGSRATRLAIIVGRSGMRTGGRFQTSINPQIIGRSGMRTGSTATRTGRIVGYSGMRTGSTAIRLAILTGSSGMRTGSTATRKSIVVGYSGMRTGSRAVASDSNAIIGYSGMRTGSTATQTSIVVTYSGMRTGSIGALNYEPEVNDLFSRIQANGGSVSPNTLIALNDFVKGCNSDGLRGTNPILKEVWIPICDTGSPMAAVLQKLWWYNTAALATVSRSPTTYSLANGVSGNGSDGFLMGVTPSVDLNPNSIHFAVYNRTDGAQDSGHGSVVRSGTYPRLYLYEKYPSGSGIVLFGVEAVSASPVIADCRGFLMGIFDAVSATKTMRVLQNGSQISSDSASVNSSLTDNFEMKIMNVNNQNPNSPTTRQTGGYSLGLAMSNTQAAAYYSRWQTLMTAIGRNV